MRPGIKGTKCAEPIRYLRRIGADNANWPHSARGCSVLANLAGEWRGFGVDKPYDRVEIGLYERIRVRTCFDETARMRPSVFRVGA